MSDAKVILNLAELSDDPADKLLLEAFYARPAPKFDESDETRSTERQRYAEDLLWEIDEG